jgi:hypothetical protein
LASHDCAVNSILSAEECRNSGLGSLATAVREN